MNNTITTPDHHLAKSFTIGNVISLPESTHLWEKHCMYHPEEGDYESSIKKSKDVLNSTTLMITDKFVIIETTGLSETLDPVIVRYINFTHKGQKVIGSLDRILFIPEWCIDNTEVVRHQLIETYVPKKLKTLSRWERVKFAFHSLKTGVFGSKSFEKSYMELYGKLIASNGHQVKFC